MKPRAKLSSTYWQQVPALKTIFHTLQSAGIEIRLVGGCVRDACLGFPPTATDIDLATPALPQLVILALKAQNIKVAPTGIKYGTVTAFLEGKSFEITTLRKDTLPQGRHTEVEYSNEWQEDALRRDFTINAIYGDYDGTIYDPCGGVDDLKRGIVRFIGIPKRRIQEDHLRILRFFRFYGRFGRGNPDPQSLAACYEHGNLLRLLSKERLRQEFFKILTGPRPTTLIKLMERSELLVSLFKLPVDMAPPRPHKPFLAALTKLEQQFNVSDPLRRFSILLPTAAKLQDHILTTWDFSKAERKRYQSLLRYIISLEEDKIDLYHTHQQQLYTLGKEAFTDQAFLKSSFRLAHGLSFYHKESREITEKLHMASNWKKPEFPLKGTDLNHLGIENGPQMGQLLKSCEAWWVEHSFHPTKEACLEHANQLLGF